MKLRFILNPHSGRNRRRPWLAPHLRDFIVEHQLDASLVVTTRPGHATELARAALVDGCDRVIAVGGDGTMNEVAQALLHSRVALGLIPCGSGNGLALHLKIPSDLEAALALAVDPSAAITAIDSGLANGHPFFNAMGCGFDAEISERFNRLTHRGLPAYLLTGYKAFRSRRTFPVVITCGRQRIERPALLVAVANSDQYGNHARIAPAAQVADGQLDLVAISPISLLAAVPLVARLFAGRLFGSPAVLALRSDRFVVERHSTGVIHTDGETHFTSARVEITVRPHSLRLVIPRRKSTVSERPVATLAHSVRFRQATPLPAACIRHPCERNQQKGCG